VKERMKKVIMIILVITLPHKNEPPRWQATQGSWTEKVARFFDGWRLKNYGDFKCLSPSKISVKKICQNWGNPYSETPKFGSSTIKKS